MAAATLAAEHGTSAPAARSAQARRTTCPQAAGALRASGRSTTEGQALSNIAPLLDRNRAFAADPGARQGMPRLPFIPNLNLYIVTCIDCRVDPAQILGVRLGEALVQRLARGRRDMLTATGGSGITQPA